MNIQRIVSAQFLVILAALTSLLDAAPVIDGKFDPNEGYDSGQVMVSFLDGSTETVVGMLYRYVDLATNDVSIAYVQSKDIVDNSYGVNAVNWPRGHSFTDLINSDKAKFRFTDADGNVVLEFLADYLSSGTSDASGYGSLGAAGGDGSLGIGSASWILGTETSLDYNFNVLGYVLTTDSPQADSSYNLTGGGTNYPGWIFDDLFEIKVSGAAFGAAGFGGVTVPEVHNSPQKAGGHPITVEPGPAKIVGAVFCDSDGNGVFDSNEHGFGDQTTTITLTGVENVRLKLSPSHDTYIKEDDKNKNFGADKKLRTKSQNNKESRTLVQFDLSSIPSDATITSVTLNLYLKENKGSQTVTVDAHRVTASWTETGATWNKRDGTNGWASSGGDFDSAVVGSFTVADHEKKVWKTLDLKALVDQWLAGTANRGILLKQGPSSSEDDKEDDEEDDKKEYTSKDETKKTSERPFLEIKYTRNLSGSTALTDNTDSQGNYSFVDLNPGTYTVTAASGPTYTSPNSVANIELEGGTTETVNFGIECSGGGGGGLLVELDSFTAVGSNGQVTLNWSTASEIDSAGFNVLRNDSPYGQFEKISYDMILAHGDSFTGADYNYTDYTVINGSTYYYMLEEIESDGDTNVHGPVNAAPGIISLTNPVNGGIVLLNDPRFEIAASRDVKRMALYISSSQTLKRKGSMRLKVKRGKSEVTLGKRAQKRLKKLASKNGWTLYSGVYGQIKGERGLKLLSNVAQFNTLLSGRVDSN